MTNSLARKDDRPTVKDVLNEIGPLPYEVVFMGMAEDGQPMMFDTRGMFGTSPNILIWNGETSFLKMVAEFILNYQSKDEIEFIVFTNNTEEWEFLARESNFQKNTPCIGVIPFWDKLADQILLALAGWVNQGLKPNHSIIVLIEGVENILKMSLDARQNFHYVFVKGKDRRVFAIGTVPKDTDLRGMNDLFYSVEFNDETNRYEFPEGENTVQVWIPRTGE